MLEAIQRYRFIAGDIYNWDEKGFLEGIASAMKHVVAVEAYKTGRVRHAAHDGSREWISLLASICADGIVFPPALIYSSESGTIMDIWLEDWNPSEKTFFIAIVNGWTCDILGLYWLERVFNPYIKQKAGFKQCLLIVNGHSNHINIKFIEKYDELRILLLVLLPYIMYCL